MKRSDLMFNLLLGGVAAASAYAGWWPLTALSGGILLLNGGTKLWFSSFSTDKIIQQNTTQKNQSSKGKTQNDFQSKFKQADLRNYRASFMTAGLAIALGTTLVAFEWSTAPPDMMFIGELQIEENGEELPPITKRTPPPPPPPPPPPEIKLDIVDDEEIIDETPIDLAMNEGDEDTEIKAQTYDEDLSDLVDAAMSSIHIDEEIELETEPEIVMIAEVMPEFPGGTQAMLEYLYGTIKYPTIARENNMEGLAVISFVVEEDGSLSNIEIKKDPGGGCGEEAVRVIKEMPNWKPGKQGLETVRVSYNLPVRFRLN